MACSFTDQVGAESEVTGETVAALPESFRFVDVNPWRPDASYSTSRYAELPPYAARHVPVTEQVWDGLVRRDATDRVVDVWCLHSLAELVGWLVDQENRAVPAEVCPECWGTTVARDWDGSITGRLGGLYLCGCIALAVETGQWVTA